MPPIRMMTILNKRRYLSFLPVVPPQRMLDTRTRSSLYCLSTLASRKSSRDELPLCTYVLDTLGQRPHNICSPQVRMWEGGKTASVLLCGTGTLTDEPIGIHSHSHSRPRSTAFPLALPIPHCKLARSHTPVSARRQETTQMHSTSNIDATLPATVSRSGTRCRPARPKVRAMYIGIGGYMVCLALWWIYTRGDPFPVLETEHYWRPTQQHSNRLIRTGQDIHAPTIAPQPEARKLKCLGWRQTGGCDANGPREPDNDLPCHRSVIGGSSGYCAFADEATGEEVRMMRLNCTSIRKDMAFKCEVAAQFTEFTADVQHAVSQYEHAKRNEEQVEQTQVDNDKISNNGIVMVMYPKLLVSVHASVRLLRWLGCTLPIELWYLESEMAGTASQLVAQHAILKSVVESYGPVTLHGISLKQITGFNSKVYAIAHSQLDNVLFLDADNVPVKDPTYLFSTPQFEAAGAIFWPDFWHPEDTLFNVQRESLLWELIDMPFVDMFEQESGQVLINKERSRAALQVLQLFAFHQPSFFDKLKLVHGDKDLFRLAWLRTNTKFHMIAHPPGAAGKLLNNVFCGMTMVQFDPSGEVAFLHRNAKKFTSESAGKSQERIWTHLQTFDLDSSAAVERTAEERYALIKEQYHIGIFGGGTLFPDTSMCYGETRERATPSGYFHIVEWGKLPFSELEPTLLDFVREALELSVEPKVVVSK